MLALLLLVHHAAGKDVQKVPTIHPIASCPDIGYYFKQDVAANAINPACNLCFCQDNNTAVCWPRDSSRCDPKRYSYSGERKRESRNRRSPGITDIFFRDAAREVFNRQTPEQCKPYESSFSEGCPPADWCIGCTVCDCDANGRWDCHTLSFCPDKKDKQKSKKKRVPQRSRRQLAKKKPTPTTKKNSKHTKKPNKSTKNNKKPKKYPSKGVKIQKKHPKSKNNKKHILPPKTKHSNKKANTKKVSQVKKWKKPFQNKKKPKPKGSNKKYVKSKKSNKQTKSNKATKNAKSKKLLDPNETVKYTKMILNRVMASVNKVVNETQKAILKDTQMKKRSIAKIMNNDKNKHKQKQSKNGGKVRKWQAIDTYVPSLKNNKKSRQKRDVINENFDNIEKENISTTFPAVEEIVFSDTKNYKKESLSIAPLLNTTSKIKYFEYKISPKQDASFIKTDNENTIRSNDIQINSTITDHTIVESGFYETSTSINRLLQNVNSSFSFNESNFNSNQKNKSCGKICELRRAFNAFVDSIGTKNITKAKENSRRIDVMAYFRKFFKTLFRTNMTNQFYLKKKANRKHNIIKSLCKNISFCKFDPMDKNLRSKIYQLKMESKKILKSVRIIKGLLRLLVDEGEYNVKNKAVVKSNQNNDILILNAILKDRYDIVENFINLTETRLTQMNYIRDNTKVFIKSIEKFAQTLSDIMSILTNKNKGIIPRRKLRCAKKYDHDISKNNTVGEKIDSLKKMLVNYNLAQNKFMKGMFDVLVTLEQKTKPNNVRLSKVSDDIGKFNDTLAIDTYAKNIIKNLRKLKELAEKLSFKKRQKRRVMGDDDAIDYFLMLIEYLLKQNRPLDVPPVSDGIDLLIEAIKAAPAIKPIKKTIFDSLISVNKTIISTTESSSTSSFYNLNKDTETIYNSDIILKSDDKIKKFELIDASDTSDVDEYNRTFQRKGLVESKSDVEIKEKSMDTTLIPKVYVAKDDDERINIMLDRYDSDKNDDKKGYEVFIDDTDEDIVIITSTRVPEVESEIDVDVRKRIPKRTTMPPFVEETTEKNSLLSSTLNTKANLDWVEDSQNREEERREVIERTTTTTQVTTQAATRTIKRRKDKYADPVSSISKEDEDIQTKTLNPEYLMYKKELNLLNSLDYETEKSVLDGDSKEEKYNSEQFSFM